MSRHTQQKLSSEIDLEQKTSRGKKGFFALWMASGFSYFIYWASQVAFPLFASQLTRSAILIAGVTFTLTVPWLAFGLLAGVLVDRYDRRRLLLALSICRLSAIFLAALAAISGYGVLPVVYVAAFIVGISQAMEEPAFAALVPMIVPQTALDRANTWLKGAQNCIDLLASIPGSIIGSLSIILMMSGIEGLAAIELIALLFLRGSYHPQRVDRHHMMREVLDGLRFVWNQQILRAISGMAAVINACWSAYLAVLVLYAVKPGPMNLTALEYGLLFTSSSIGGIAGSLMAMPLQRWLGRRWAIGLNILGNGALFAAPTFSANPWLIGSAAVLAGFTGPLWSIAAAALIGRSVPMHLQGRTNAAYSFIGTGAMALGPVFGGLIAQFMGLRSVFIACTCLTLLMLIPFFGVVSEAAMSGE